MFSLYFEILLQNIECTAPDWAIFCLQCLEVGRNFKMEVIVMVIVIVILLKIIFLDLSLDHTFATSYITHGVC